MTLGLPISTVITIISANITRSAMSISLLATDATKSVEETGITPIQQISDAMAAQFKEIDNTALWWMFREKRNEAQAQFIATKDMNYLHTAKQYQNLMDGCFEAIKQGL